MHASSKLRSLRKLTTRDPPAQSPTMQTSSRRDVQMPAKKRGNQPAAAPVNAVGANGNGEPTPITWRRNSSAEIPIPPFMIPCSASSLMNTKYALTPSRATTDTANRYAIPQR